MKEYELIVIGSGPAGEKAAVKAAYFGRKVALVEKEKLFGGAQTVTGTLPSKTLRETSLYFSGKYEKGLYGIDRDLKRSASAEDFLFRKDLVTKATAKEVEENIKRHKIDIYRGAATFDDPHTIRVKGAKEEVISGKFILIATGSYPVHPPMIPFDGERVHDSDTILHIERFPTSMCIIGAGVIGCEYATIFSTMGTHVFLVNDKTEILSYLDRDITDLLVKGMAESGVEILFNTSVESVKKTEKDIEIKLKSGESLHVDILLFAAGRNGNIKALDLPKVGVEYDKREDIKVNEKYQTSVPHIYAAGDVIGFPALASTSMDQGRVAVAHMFQTEDLKSLPTVVPFAIYTVPELSAVGLTEEGAKKEGIPYATGKARHADLARGIIMGAKAGFLKLVFHRETLVILGVHVIGPLASELVHYGVSLIEEKRTLYTVINHVFNFPTLHDLYKYAAFDGLSTIAGKRIKT